MDALLQKGILTNFFEAYEATAPVADELMTKVTSTGAGEDYAWISGNPSLRKMLGERVPQRFKAYKYHLDNEEYEASVEVLRKDIKDDTTGKYLTQARSIGESVKEFPDEQIFGDLLPNGFANLAYDGQYFFDTDHGYGEDGAVQSNLLTSALDATSFATARTMLRQMKLDNGKRINKKLDLRLIVPVELEATARGIVEPENIIVGGVPVANPNYQAAKVVVSTELTDANNWYLANVAGTILPFVEQTREFIPFEALEDGSEKAWWNKIYYYGTYWRGAYGYGLYQKIVGANVA